MKKSFILSVLAFAFVGGLMFGEEKVLIDFSKLSADFEEQNRHTLKDYSANAGMTFTQEQKDLMKSSLAVSNWEVQLNSSARTRDSLMNSLVKPAPVREGDDVLVKFDEGSAREVMGVRVHFPSSNVSASARILPPFEIPSFDYSDVSEDGTISVREQRKGPTRFEDGYGVVTNVGTIKSVKVTTLGMNQPHGLYVILKDQTGAERRYFMGYLNFDGWREIVWSNPSYVQEVRAREIRSIPIYPTAVPHVKFVGFQITRDATCEGGDFIGYFKDVAVIYDKAALETERDVADEDVWGIVTAREEARQAQEMKNFGLRQVELFLEREKQATETKFTSSLNGEDDEQDAQGGNAAAPATEAQPAAEEGAN